MADRLQLRRDLTAVWTLVNPVLADGEPGYERDTHKMKVGDGATPWNTLPYSGATSSDASYIHAQAVPSTTWTITHNLGKYPAVTVIDSAGEEVEGEVAHASLNALQITFSAGFSGTASLN